MSQFVREYGVVPANVVYTTSAIPESRQSGRDSVHAWRRSTGKMIRVNLRNCSVYACVLVGILVVIGCGSESRDAQTSSSSRIAGKSGCWRGKMTLGTAPGAINFSVGCASVRPSKKFAFLLTRDSLSGPRGGPGIRAFRKYPPLSGPGAIGLHGRCELGEYRLVCQGRSRGRFELHGRVWVNPQTRCSTNVALALHELPANCSGKHVCFAVFVTRPLVEGLPGGC